MEPIKRRMEPGELLAIHQNRYTCKSFDPNRKVAAEDLAAILEVGRLSPSSMGMEPWHFVVYERGPLTDEFLSHCWGYHGEASHIIALLACNYPHLLRNGQHVAHIHTDIQGLPADKLEARYDKMDVFLHQDLQMVNDEYQVQGWIDRQVYIAFGNMLTAAAALGVDATAIEGLQLAPVSQIMIKQGAFDPQQYRLLSLMALGYTNRAEHRPKTRRPESEVITYL